MNFDYLFAGLYYKTCKKSYPALCPHCKKIIVRKANKGSRHSYCEKTQQCVKLLNLR